MAERLKEAYRTLFQANEYAWKLNKEQLSEKLKSLTGAAADDEYIPSVVGTFLALNKLAKWEGGAAKKKEPESEVDKGEGGGNGGGRKREEEFAEGKLRLSYTINLNLPATTEIEVFKLSSKVCGRIC